MKSIFSKSKLIKYGIIAFVVLLIAVLIILIYKNLFANSNQDRFVDVDKHKLTKEEISAVKEKFESVKSVDSVDVYIKSKIIRIFVKISDDVTLEKMKEVSNESITCFTEENLKYYDLEVFIDTSNEDSKLYPQIGYKNKLSEEFSW